MAIKQETCTNPAVVEALGMILEEKDGYIVPKRWPIPVTHGLFNRLMFLETLVLKGGMGVSMDRESLMSYACITEREFEAIKDEYLDKGIIKEVKDPIVGEPLYSLQLTPKEGAI